MSINLVTNEKYAFSDRLPPSLLPTEEERTESRTAQGCALIIIDPRALDRECLARSIRAHDTTMDVWSFASLEEWRRMRDAMPPVSAVLMSIGARKISEPAVAEEMKKIATEFGEAPVVLLADTDNLNQILSALSLGARGFIPSSVGIEVCVEAIKLALAGGVFVPASSVLGMREAIEARSEKTTPLSSFFTLRQAEVAEALRRGKANKIIAYELNLRESTVKVHIRNIMKKLKATNRTEVAFKINDLFPTGH